MAEKHGVVRTDKMYGTDTRTGLVSLRYGGADGDTDTAIDNGNVVVLAGLLEGERELYKAKDPTGTEALRDVVLVASPEVMYDERLRSLYDFYNEAGEAARGYHLHRGDIFSVTEEALDGTKAVNDYVMLNAGIKMNTAAAQNTSKTTVGKIIAKDVVGIYTYYVIEVGEVAATV